MAVVMVDGGRMQTRKPGRGPGVHDASWRESKTALLLRMTNHPSEVDPQPELPTCFAHPPGAMDKPSSIADSTPAADEPKPREILFRTGLATLGNSNDFAWQAAAAAENRGFFSARAKAFVSDGQAYNWSIQRGHFPSFEPILDFVHAAEHIHKAAASAEAPGESWVEACWQGRVTEIISKIADHLSRLTPPIDPDAEPDHPWCVLRREHGYLTNNQERMDYPRYRREGLPITSSPIESWIKQMNQRVKGSDKFWNDDENAEAILQLRTAWLGDDEELTTYLNSRRGQTTAKPPNSINSLKAA